MNTPLEKLLEAADALRKTSSCIIGAGDALELRLKDHELRKAVADYQDAKAEYEASVVSEKDVL